MIRTIQYRHYPPSGSPSTRDWHRADQPFFLACLWANSTTRAMIVSDGKG